MAKGGATEAIRTAFMRRKLDDWESAENFVTTYTREQVERFSPKSHAILEIQSERDLEILNKIYATGVLLEDDTNGGWGVKHKLEFMMNTDAHLFHPGHNGRRKATAPMSTAAGCSVTGAPLRSSGKNSTASDPI